MEKRLCKSLKWQFTFLTPHAIIDHLFECLKNALSNRPSVDFQIDRLHSIVKQVCDALAVPLIKQKFISLPSDIVITVLRSVNSRKDVQVKFKSELVLSMHGICKEFIFILKSSVIRPPQMYEP